MDRGGGAPGQSGSDFIHRHSRMPYERKEQKQVAALMCSSRLARHVSEELEESMAVVSRQTQ